MFLVVVGSVIICFCYNGNRGHSCNNIKRGWNVHLFSRRWRRSSYVHINILNNNNNYETPSQSLLSPCPLGFDTSDIVNDGLILMDNDTYDIDNDDLLLVDDGLLTSTLLLRLDDGI